MPIQYKITVKDPQAHVFLVEMAIANVHEGELVLMLPAWLPGSYMIRDMASDLSDVRALVDGKAWAIGKIDKTSWHLTVPAGTREVRIAYSVFAQDRSVRRAYLDTRRGFFNASSLCLAALGYRNRPVTIRIKAPSEYCKKWSLATTLEPENVDKKGFGTYRAAHYEDLIDHPVEMGAWEAIDFVAGGVPHRIIVSGAGLDFDRERLRRDVTKACESVIAFFEPQSKKPPFKRYDFYLNLSAADYGGLEHADSTALIASRFDLPQADTGDDDEDYVRLLGLFCHEYFHAWWVKRIKPAAFIPYNLAAETYTNLLWVFEGFTSYYDHLLLLRAGLISRQMYLKELARTMTRHLSAAARRHQTLAESSFDAWIKYYKLRTNRNNAVVSYYDKGALVAFALDALIRHETQAARSLDDVLRFAWEGFKSAGDDYAGMEEEEIGRLIYEAVGVAVDKKLDRWVYGCDEPDYEKLLRQQGVEFGQKPLPWVRSMLGLTLDTNSPFGIRSVDENGPAQKAGLSVGDELVAIEGLKVNKGNLEKMLKRLADKKRLRVHVFRDDCLMEFDVQAAPAAAFEVQLKVNNAELGYGFLGK